MNRMIEFFEGDNRRLSMTRLLNFMAFPPSTYIAIQVGTAEALGIYGGIWVLGYLGGKTADAVVAMKAKA